MKKLLLLPAMAFPYTFILGCLIGDKYSDGNYALYALWGFLLLVFILPLICNIIYVVLSQKDDPNDLIRAALVIKLVHIPSYVCVFIFGVIASIMIFMTLPLILLLILFDYIVLLSSSLIAVFALAKNAKNHKILSVVALICQFVFCADVISLIVLRFISKKQKQTIST